MTTLLEAAQGVVDSANRLGTTNTMLLPYYLIEALEQAIAQEQRKQVAPIPCKCFDNVAKRLCKDKNKCSKVEAYSNWEPKP